MSKTVSESYLSGIREGRDYLKRFRPTAEEAREVLANVRGTLKGFKNGPVADMLRGERDFWDNQLKKGLLP